MSSGLPGGVEATETFSVESPLCLRDRSSLGDKSPDFTEGGAGEWEWL